MSTHRGAVCLGLSLSALISVVAFAQSDAVENGGPLSGPPPLNAPFSADATTTVLHRLKDGSSVERKMTARYYRDAAGRVRVEQKTPADRGDADRITVFPDPASWRGYTLYPSSKSATGATRSIADIAVGGGTHFAVPLDGVSVIAFHRSPPSPIADTVSDEALGAKQISGVDTVGRRVKRIVWTGGLGNDRPIEIVDERWESPELKLLIYSRFSDSRSGDIEYLLTNIRRLEPLADLFEVPADYTIRLATGTTGWWMSLVPPSSATAQAR